MKKIILIAIVGFSIYGCADFCINQKDYYVYTIKNESGYPIEIKSYAVYQGGLAHEKIFLSEGKSLTKKDRGGCDWHESGRGLSVFFGNGSSRSDSLVILYNNQKRGVFTKNDPDVEYSERNPFNRIYTGRYVTFTFTTEDYENATPCNGDCE